MLIPVDAFSCTLTYITYNWCTLRLTFDLQVTPCAKIGAKESDGKAETKAVARGEHEGGCSLCSEWKAFCVKDIEQLV